MLLQYFYFFTTVHFFLCLIYKLSFIICLYIGKRVYTGFFTMYVFKASTGRPWMVSP